MSNLVCCKNIGHDRYKACGQPATLFYAHNGDVCPYCPEHDYPCGELIPPEKVEQVMYTAPNGTVLPVSRVNAR